MRKKFSPEFVNRIDAVITYQPLDAESLEAILDHQIRSSRTMSTAGWASAVLPSMFPTTAASFCCAPEPRAIRRTRAESYRPPAAHQPLATMVATGQFPPAASSARICRRTRRAW